jgi:hypothetical protein
MIIEFATIIFFICSLINVMLSTLKTILTVKASKGVATIINAITYGFYAIVIKQLASLDLITTVTVTIVTNIIGVYVSMWLLEKTKKDCLWKISVTTKDNTLVEKLEKFSISYVMNPVQYKKQTYYNIDVFSENQKDSSIIENILKEYKVKYNITEINKKF